VLLLTLIAAALAVCRLARLVAEDVIMLPFRRMILRQFGDEAFITKLVHCAPWCMSMWFSVLMPVAVFWPNRWVLAAFAIPAASMVAAIILTLVDKE
jgi:hypothetical protein